MNVKGHHYALAALGKMLASDGKRQITIAADKDVPFEGVVEVMDAWQKAGVSNIGVTAKPH